MSAPVEHARAAAAARGAGLTCASAATHLVPHARLGVAQRGLQSRPTIGRRRSSRGCARCCARRTSAGRRATARAARGCRGTARRSPRRAARRVAALLALGQREVEPVHRRRRPARARARRTRRRRAGSCCVERLDHARDRDRLEQLLREARRVTSPCAGALAQQRQRLAAPRVHAPCGDRLRAARAAGSGPARAGRRRLGLAAQERAARSASVGRHRRDRVLRPNSARKRSTSVGASDVELVEAGLDLDREVAERSSRRSACPPPPPRCRPPSASSARGVAVLALRAAAVGHGRRRPPPSAGGPPPPDVALGRARSRRRVLGGAPPTAASRGRPRSALWPVTGEQRVEQGVELARLDAGRERERAHAVAEERQREVVVARARRIERDVLAQHVVGGEPVGQRPVLVQQPLRERRRDPRGSG